MFPKFWPNFKNFLPSFSRGKKGVNFWKLLVQSKAWNLEDFEKIGDSLEFFLKNWPKMVKFSQLFAKIQLENIENFDENGQLSVFQGKIGQFSKLFAKIMRNLEGKKKGLLPIYQDLLEVKNQKKKSPKLSFVWREGGRKEEKKSLNKQGKF